MKRRKEGDTLILDNGAYEGVEQEQVLERMKHLMRILDPQIVVLPDLLLQDGDRSLDLSLRARDELDKYDHKASYMFIPQAQPGRVEDWYRIAQAAYLEYGFKNFGVPRALATHISSKQYERINAVDVIRTWQKVGDKIYIHAFGMADGCPHELYYLNDAGADSCDSSAPVWRGWNGLSLSEADRKRWRRDGNPCNFDAVDVPAPERNRDWQIISNLEACGVDASKLR